jgi:hypothetical protein
MRGILKRSLVACVWVVLAACTAVGADDPAAARFRGTGAADPIRVENLKKAAGPAAGQTSLGFDVAWNHSWRGRWEVPAQAHGGKGPLAVENWDAAWLFVKFRVPGADGWSHATLSANAADHAVPPAAKLDVGLSDEGTKGAGVFAFRSAVGSGPNDWKGVTLRWLHEADGVADPAAAEVQVFAVHMVLVPEGAFWLGDGSTSFVGGQFSAGDTSAPYRVESEAAIELGGDGPKNLGNRDTVGMYFRTDDFSTGVTKTLPARFPKGHAAFYCMRHELTEREIVAWLNALSSKAQATIQPFQDKGNALAGIKVVTPASPGTPAVYASDRPHVACDYVMWSDGTGYSTWAGLRPMTELEFEKACRGPLLPVADEYAWGTSAIAVGAPAGKGGGPQAGYVVANAGQPDERLSWQGENGPDATRGNAVWGGAIRREAKGGVAANAVTRPVRPGIFATPESDRVAAGSSYWGVLDLTGNLAERVLTVGNIAGRRFAGTHGAWPAPFATIGLGANQRKPEEWAWGFGTRGGQWQDGTDVLRTSDRQASGYVSAVLPARSRFSSGRTGFRCVRTARIVPFELKPADVVVATPLSSHGHAAVQPAVSGWGDDCVTTVANVTVTPRDAKTATITFDLSWSNSWRNDQNHDAAWVFFKARSDDAGWRHVKLVADRVLNPTGYGHAEGDTKVDLLVPDGPDGFTGAFVRRVAVGKGPLKVEKVTVVCDADAVKGIAADAKDRVRGVGVQMVYVPEGPFRLGAGGPEVGAFHEYTTGVDATKPYRVANAGPIPTGRTPGRLWAAKHGGPLVDGGEIPASYPNGFGSFYCMKFHVTPVQYAEFLNTLDAKLADERYPGPDRCVYNKVVYSGKNGHVTKVPSGEYVGKPGRERAGAGCFGLSWADGTAYAAWAGLRPMTELELEKACRGPRDPVPSELGPSYWGVSGFGGVDWDAFKGDTACERPVTAGKTGLGFKGSHGLGTTALPADWPQADAVGSAVRHTHYSSLNLERLRGLTEPPGFFQPAGISSFELPRARISDRMFSGVADAERLWSHKWRGARTAPKAAAH